MLKGIEFYPEYAKVRTWLQKLLKTLKLIVNNSGKGIYYYIPHRTTGHIV